MRRVPVRFRFVAAWTAVTATGMAISWAGVGDALRGTVIDSPDLAAGIRAESQGSAAFPPGTPAPGANGSGASPTGPVTTPPTHDPRTPSHSPSKHETPDSSGGSPGEKARTYVVKAGRVVYALNATSARLVSATPNAGFQAKVWRTSTWIRVDLTDGTHGSTVIAVWNGHPPLVQISEF